MDQPLISIVLTTCNSEDTISDVLDAIMKQDMPLSSMELIVVDDGSKDHTLEIVRDFFEKYGSLFHDIKLILHDRNYGVSKARNDGMKVSAGKYILVIDDDIIMNRSTIKNLLRFLDNLPRNVAAVMPVYIGYPENILDRWKRLIREGKVSPASAITSCALIRREAFEKIGFYDETLGIPFTMGEEIEYAARAKNKGYHALILGSEKVLHVDDEKWREKKRMTVYGINNVKLKEKRIKPLLDALRKSFDAAKSIKTQPYRYAYKKYVASLPFFDKLKWYGYAAVMLNMVLLPVFLCLSTILDAFISITQFLTSILLITCFALYLDVLREYWNPRVLHISLVYSSIALMWRMFRSMMLLMPSRHQKSI
ncbi:MAG: glycosyltransferase [Crenarchaeota archaeon]|nr:glycosyltransferase [Thermoproteota archaeon]